MESPSWRFGNVRKTSVAAEICPVLILRRIDQLVYHELSSFI